MTRSLKLLTVTLLLVATGTTAFSYIAYVTGRKTLPGCNFGEGVSCVGKFDLPGPPETPGEVLSGTALIDTASSVQVSGTLYVAPPVDPYQFVGQNGGVLQAIWYTTDGSPCPIPNP